ncbi:hypothetical protein RF11_10708 [Thelohanellus kitauei]|uniref:Uncharacterized protein n=1 Tax=Thelohanellus kitauei TaxID=669202 RepID=A0A0C2JLL2_THEKT|nr:hypothetical protein RF11_10708 [Thelohanellus kitauei]
MAENISTVNSSEHKRWAQLLDSVDQLEKFYANQIAIFKVLSSDYDKKTKKRIRQAHKDALSHPSTKSLKAEESIASEVTSHFQKSMQNYDKNFNTMCSIVDVTALPHTDLTTMLKNPGMYCMKKHRPIAINTVFPRRKFFLPTNKTFDQAIKLHIAWSPFKAKSPGCIDLNPVIILVIKGDTINQTSEEINGWIYGTNMTTKQYFLS